MHVNRKLTIFSALLLFALGSVDTARADMNQDGGIWAMGLARGSFEAVSPKVAKLQWWLEGQGRWFDDTDGYGQGIVRPGIGWALSDDLTVWLGYAWIHDRPEVGDDFHENRLWQQALWSHAFEHVKVDSRSRLEQRWVSRGDDVGVRYRQLVKVAYPLPPLPRLALAGYGEIFLNFNDTDWGAEAGLDQTRAFVGLSWAFDRQGRVVGEVGYLNRYIYQKSGDGRMDHLLSINVLLNF